VLRTFWFSFASLLAFAACTTLPTPKHDKFRFPKDAYIDPPPNREFVALGTVNSSKVNFVSLDPNYEESQLCRNYYNKAVAELVKFAKAKGADAVINVRSVVFLEDGRVETYKTPECSDDGGEGQILARGTAVRWKPAQPSTFELPPAQKPALAPSPRPSP
jgi:hypothetical protein